MISILFIVRKNWLRRNGRTPIYVRITVDSVSVEFTSDREVEPEQWITARGRAKPLASKNKALNAYLDQIEIDLFNIGQAMQREGCMVTAREIMHRYKGIEQSKDFICAIYEEHNAKLKELVDKSVALNTYKRHVTSLKLFREFLMAAKGVADLPAKELSVQLIEEYKHYLMTVRSNNNNTTVKYLRNLSKVINQVKARGVIHTNPIDLLPLKMQPVEREFLTDEELNRLCEKSIEFMRLSQVRDIFVFCCYTGLAYTDVATLTPANIVSSKHGKLWIRKARNKTSNMCNIPLLKPALSILERYEEYQQKTRKLLPVPTNQKMNAYLKELAILCGVTKNLTTHLARHTFATTVTLGNGASLETVSKMLGHSSIRMTQHYAKILNSSIERDMAKVEASLLK